MCEWRSVVCLQAVVCPESTCSSQRLLGDLHRDRMGGGGSGASRSR